jgi:sialate O-acetylesterase
MQSNMVYGLNYVDRYDPGHGAVSNADEPLLRLFTTAQQPSRTPSPDATSATNYTWAVSSPAAVNTSDSGFSAACWFAGKALLVGNSDAGTPATGRATAGMPIGLMVSAWDGTVIEAWSPPAALRECDGPGRRQALELQHGPPGTAPGPEEPSVLYNGLVRPLLRLGLRAVVSQIRFSPTAVDIANAEFNRMVCM